MRRRVLVFTVALLLSFSSILDVTSAGSLHKYKREHPFIHSIKIYHPRTIRRKPKNVFAGYNSIKTYKPKPVYGPPSGSIPEINLHHYVHYCSPGSPVEQAGQFPTEEYVLQPPKHYYHFDHPRQQFAEQDFEEFRKPAVEFEPPVLKPNSDEIIIPESTGTLLVNNKQNNVYDYVEIPDVNPPLDYSPKSTYNTPGAVTSYGTPAQIDNHEQHLFEHQQNHGGLFEPHHREKTKVEDYFEVELQNNYDDSADFSRRQRQSDLAASPSVNLNVSSPSSTKSESNNGTTVTSMLAKHPNHKYEEGDDDHSEII